MWTSDNDVVENYSKRNDGNWYSLYKSGVDIRYCFYLTDKQVVDYISKGYIVAKENSDFDITPVRDLKKELVETQKKLDSLTRAFNYYRSKKKVSDVND